MQIIKQVITVLAVAGMVTATPFAPYLNQTKLSLAMTQGNTNNADFFLMSVSSPSAVVSADAQKRQVNDTEPEPEPAADNSSVAKRHEHQNAKTEEEGRIGKLPYRKFPPCYVSCFDSEGVDSKTWPAIGDIRDLTTYEFCESQAMWVGAWFFEHLRFCIHGSCKDCLYDCGMASGKVYNELCGRDFW
ncbi:hypothetical protein LQW54_013290 [Pestalotiopsis sp. IQ-011]